MKLLLKNDGFSLLEMIITIGLIAIAISLSTFGLSVIYNGNVNSRASEIINEIRITQSRQLASSTKNYDITFTNNGTNYVMTTSYISGGHTTVIKNIKLPNKMSIMKLVGTNYVELSTITDNPSDTTKASYVKTIRFDPSSGKITTNAYNRYKITATNSDVEVVFVIVKENGRVYVEQ